MNKEFDSVKKMKDSSESLLPYVPAKYGYLEHIQSYKHLCNPNDESLKKKVR